MAMLRNSQGVPMFNRISTTKNPADKTIQIQTAYPFVFVYQSMQGAPLGVSQAPTDVFSPLVASWTFPQIPYPTTVSVEVLDGASHQSYGSFTLSLFGGDVFKMVITYPSTESNNPASHGFIDAMVDGQRMTINAQDYIQQDFFRDDVWTRGSGN